MARMRVGEIEIDGSNVRIGGRRPTSAECPLPPPPRSGLVFLDRVPVSPRLLAMVGGAVAAGSAVLIAVWGAQPTRAGLGVLGFALAPVGTAILMLGALKWWRERGLPGFESLRADPATEERLAALELTLRQAGKALPARVIGERLGWPAADVDRGLAWLTARVLVEEDFDEACGEYVYSLVKPASDLTTRLHQLDSGA